MRAFVLVTWIALALAAASARAAQDEGNCRLLIQTRYTSGKKKVELTFVDTESRDQCKAEARARELDSAEDGVLSRKANFGWRAREK